MIVCQLFDIHTEAGYDAFWEHGVGAMSWTRIVKDGVRGSHRALYIVVPDNRWEHGVPLCLYVEHETNNWAHDGPVKGWDGNIEKPTLSPSIQVLQDGKPTGWHGWLRAGVLEDA